MSKGIGNGFGLYLTQTDPSAGPGDITNYDLAGFDKDLTFPRSRNMIDASDKDSGADSEYEPGRRDATVEGTFNRDLAFENDAGQAHAITAYEADTKANSKVWWLVTDNVVGNVQWYGEGFVSQADESFPDEGMAELSVTIQVSGSVTRQAVTT